MGLGFLFCSDVNAQSSNQVCQSVEGSSFTWPDSLIVDPSSIRLQPDSPFSLNGDEGVDFKENYKGEICYRYFPLKKNQPIQNRSAAAYDSTVSFPRLVYQEVNAYEKDELFQTPNIYKAGSLTRGVSFGNSQSMNVLSGFNFQMDGQLTDDLNIRADITDQNVPFQPEGNTQQIREFDNVTFEIYNDSLSLMAGDVVIQNDPNSYFMRHYKNALGGQGKVSYSIGENGKGQSSLAIAAAKGQFADVTLQAEEGLQGPYQLNGPTGQNYVVVIANSEKVYLDGQLLKRGFNHDYIIDYNLGEITFNPSVLITQFSRIRVTFEYSDRNYSRSIIAAQQSLDLGKVKFHAGYYREKDNRNKPLAFSLSNEDKEQISLAGDDLPVAIDGARGSEYNSDLVLYEQRDTVDNDGNPKQVYVYSRDSTAELYRVTFSEVGAGNGSYNLVDNDVNGRVYEWVSPTSGQPQGKYEAVRFVPAPNMRQLISLGSELQLTQHLSVFSEAAFSDQDQNLFSPEGSEDDKDWAIKSGVALKGKPVGSYKLDAQVDYEYDGANFKPIDRYRSIEYDRNWSYQPGQDSSGSADNIFNAGFSLKKDKNNLVQTKYSLRDKEGAVEGRQWEAAIAQSLGGMKVKAGIFDLQSENARERSQWRRMYAESFFDAFLLVPGYRYEWDRNEVSLNANDSLLRTAMNYASHQFYIRNHDTLRTQFRLDYTLREDQSIREGALLPYSQSRTTRAQVNSRIAKGHDLGLNFSYREMDYQQAFEDQLEDERLILGNLHYRGSFFKGHVRSDMNYTTSSSREILREFIFVEVATGDGTHAWRDLNGDGVQDLTEFFEAINFDERRYIKIFVPTSEFVEAFQTQFSFSANLSMPRGWASEGGFRAFLSQFSNTSSININKKTTGESLDLRFNPFTLDIKDDDLVYARDGIRSTVFFNRSGRGLGWELSYQTQASKQLISRGIESRSSREWLASARYHFGSEWIVNVQWSDQLKENASQYTEDRNYIIQAVEVGPGLIWQPKNNFRVSVDYSYEDKVNIAEGSDVDEKARLNVMETETRWSNGSKNVLTAFVSYAHIDYQGEVNTAAAYELLNAQQPGDNYNWRINFSQKLMSGLQMTLGYEGRKSADLSTVHTGRLQITALF
ncbi:hypothetical protein [Reichenbachiella ulvae]|uniref:Cell surface protein SprA n=1 Tax=Reichenbachiella ulvae TaxID=2980104 RepID=A0ABT3CVT3_9BACT|nr:hypothetical protein [Reichenbachiella ulvae]MCV9387653.1 hypothetical protein [Reichenbachiella ulvae]